MLNVQWTIDRIWICPIFWLDCKFIIFRATCGPELALSHSTAINQFHNFVGSYTFLLFYFYWYFLLRFFFCSGSERNAKLQNSQPKQKLNKRNHVDRKIYGTFRHAIRRNSYHKLFTRSGCLFYLFL